MLGRAELSLGYQSASDPPYHCCRRLTHPLRWTDRSSADVSVPRRCYALSGFSRSPDHQRSGWLSDSGKPRDSSADAGRCLQRNEEQSGQAVGDRGSVLPLGLGLSRSYHHVHAGVLSALRRPEQPSKMAAIRRMDSSSASPLIRVAPILLKQRNAFVALGAVGLSLGAAWAWNHRRKPDADASELAADVAPKAASPQKRHRKRHKSRTKAPAECEQPLRECAAEPVPPPNASSPPASEPAAERAQQVREETPSREGAGRRRRV